ncbi:hypothetical protein JOF56_007477 [Kibdelosporangium banguiense]|uniref:Uncharacterized protein n=1 Tax=Kibdelosporangium banguiense TaxID=1365924 RepID=A0ABS4TRP4_9PSEU|nr:hypothetical protein [Kibdelosporangium banguiense]
MSHWISVIEVVGSTFGCAAAAANLTSALLRFRRPSERKSAAPSPPQRSEEGS